jgi:hypothetical protein
MGGSYWAPLSDVLPADVVDAMSRATQPGKPDRPGETGIHTAVRALITHTVPRVEHDARLAEVVRQQRATFETGQQAAREAYERGLAEARADREALARVWALVDRNRKTLQMADLIAALDPDGRDR